METLCISETSVALRGVTTQNTVIFGWITTIERIIYNMSMYIFIILYGIYFLWPFSLGKWRTAFNEVVFGNPTVA
jgi:hypothetical protein